MRLTEEIAEGQKRFGLLSFYEKFEHIVILMLTALIAIFIGVRSLESRSQSFFEHRYKHRDYCA
jgi:hypothetical protein